MDGATTSVTTKASRTSTAQAVCRCSTLEPDRGQREMEFD
jgi:hypothetical protein